MSDPVPEPAMPAPHEAVCGNCKLWQSHSVDTRGWVGPCRLQPQRGMFPAGAPACNAFVAKGSASAPEARQAPAKVARAVAPVIVRKGSEVSANVDLGGAMTRDELMEIFLEASGQAVVPLAPKWEGGVIKLVPGNTELQGKDLPIDTLFHKVVMVRDRLRTLEQRLNAHPKLSDAEKVELQQYITRIYGSLTSFNVLFRDKGDQFVGQKGED